jgi:hypothetical protein
MRRCHLARMWQITNAHRLLILVQTLCSTSRLRTTGTAKSHSVQALQQRNVAEVRRLPHHVSVGTLYLDRHRGLQDYQTVGTLRWQGGQPYAPTAFTPQKRSPVLISVRG